MSLSDLPNWTVPAVSLASSVIVAFANYMVQRWRYGIDRLSVAVDQFCTELNSAADLATRYWLLDLSQIVNRPEAQGTEPGLVGRQLRLQELVLSLKDHPSFDISAVDEMFDQLYDAMSGGTFRTNGRAPDPDRAQKVQAVAASINGLMRRSLGKRGRQLLP